VVDQTTVRRWLRPALVAAGVLAHRLLTHPIACGARPDPAQTLVVMSWNLENFPGDHDIDTMAAKIAAAQPHVIAVQEVLDPAALAELAPDRRAVLSTRGGARVQRLGLLVDEDTVVEDVVEHATVEHGGRVRPALSSHVEIGDVDFHLVVVHLKATPDGLPIRRMQWAALVDLLARITLHPDRDVIVVGDFNTTGKGDVSAADERDELAAVLAVLDVRPVTIDGGCSAYWDGQRRDAWLEPALLDLVFVRGFDGAELRARTLGACRTHACAPLRSTAAHPDPDIAASSDHCPLLLEIDAAH
jgi:endonuclease/exonuclease/phosphatase family metal-dependent hydrolase